MSHIVIVGSGVVGQATGRGFAKKGHSITYVDVSPETITQLRAEGQRAMVIEEVAWDTVDIVMVSVSTPTIDRAIVLDHIKQSARDIALGLASTDRYICVVVRSTVPPTTTESQIKPILEAVSGKTAGVDFGLAMNPEFLRQRSSERDFDQPWITVLGTSEAETARRLNALYTSFGALIVNCKPTEAEMIKYVNNIYNAVKISYFNEVHQICNQLDIDSNIIGAVVARSAESMWNPLYGIRGGVPYGGACLPKDTEAFMEFCEDRGFEHLTLAATIDANEQLLASVPAVESPEEIDLVRQQTCVDVNEIHSNNIDGYEVSAVSRYHHNRNGTLHVNHRRPQTQLR